MWRRAWLFEDIHVRELWVTLLLIPVFVIISLYFFACDTSSHQVCVVVLYATAAATAALRWSCSLSHWHTCSLAQLRSLSGAWFAGCSTRHYSILYPRTHASISRSGLYCFTPDWTGLDCAARSLRSARRSLISVG